MTKIIEFPVRAEEKIVWQCNCGCQLFYIVPEGCECSDCGVIAVFED